MNKALMIIVGLLLLGAVGVGAYWIGSNQNGSDDTVSQQKITMEAGSETPEAESLEGNELVRATLDKVKAETSTVQHTRILTEETDENNLLGKRGEYQYAGIFYDTRTEYEPMNENGEPVDIANDNYGTTAGGSIEVFATNEDAKRRGELLEGFQTGFINAGPYRVVENVVLRASENYTASQQQEMLDLLEKSLKDSL